MADILLPLLLVLTLIGCLALGVWVSVALFTTGVVGVLLFSNAPITSVLGTNMWSSSSEWSLAALPLFIWISIYLRTN